VTLFILSEKKVKGVKMLKQSVNHRGTTGEVKAEKL